MHDPVFGAITIQEILTKAKEGFARRAIVLEDDALGNTIKGPCDGGTHRNSAAQIHLAEERPYLAVPMDVRHDAPGPLALARIALDIGAWAVRRDIEVARTNGPYASPHH